MFRTSRASSWASSSFQAKPSWAIQ